MKAAPRPRVDVNLEELDQIIDGGMRAPLSESDGEKLKAVLHILAERAKPRWRTTEKTCAVEKPRAPAHDFRESDGVWDRNQPTEVLVTKNLRVPTTSCVT
jgi:hypothetical protein